MVENSVGQQCNVLCDEQISPVMPLLDLENGKKAFFALLFKQLSKVLVTDARVSEFFVNPFLTTPVSEELHKFP